jgi:hypothetical protein
VTVDELMELLESCPMGGEIRIGWPGNPPLQAAVIGITSTHELSLQPGTKPSQPSAVWILAGPAASTFLSRAWHPGARRRP